ncbi:MAG TPA: hypothetical protein VFD59_07955 [Nocardioidaceae bacterium]|nr:hypothetical protein [Nocardioidaceae bacterium]
MKANVYVLVESRATGDRAFTDIYMLGGTQQELLDYYESLKGRAPGDVEREVKDGFEHLSFDRDETGVSMISQYQVGIVEVLEP